MDRREKALLRLVYDENGVSTEDDRLAPFIDDRGDEDDTVNRCIRAKAIWQVGSEDNFSLVPWWWPYRNAEQAARLAGWKSPI